MSKKAVSAPANGARINDQAPIILRAEIEVTAPPDLVWEVLSGIDGWPNWNPEVKQASLDGPLVEGATFRWKAGPSSLTSKLVTVAASRQIAWTGKLMGLRAIHVYNLEPRDGKTLVRTEESVEGSLAHVFRGSLTKRMNAAIHRGLESLKTEAERRAAS
jgi:hypothetical protein